VISPLWCAQTAWYAARKLCGGRDAVRVELVSLFCTWLFLNNRAADLVNFVFSEEVCLLFYLCDMCDMCDLFYCVQFICQLSCLQLKLNNILLLQDHLVLESTLYEHCSECLAAAVASRGGGGGGGEGGMDVEGEEGADADAASLVSGARAVEAADIYLLYLLARNKVGAALAAARLPLLGGYLSADVFQLLAAQAAGSELLAKQTPCLLSAPARPQRRGGGQRPVAIRYIPLLTLCLCVSDILLYF
jgi:hypothetical protein